MTRFRPKGAAASAPSPDSRPASIARRALVGALPAAALLQDHA